jgi:hypothetical protein
VYYGSGPRLPAEVGSGAAMYPMAPDLASRLRWAPVLPRVLYLQTSPPDWGRLWRCHVSHCSLRATCFKHKEKPSRPDCVARHACYQRTRERFKRASRQGHHAPARCVDMQCSQYLQSVHTDIYSAATVRLQYDTSTVVHSSVTATVPSDSTV